MISEDRFSPSLDELQNGVNDVYFNRDLKKNDSSILMDLIASMGELSKSLRRNEKLIINHSIAKIFTHVLRIYNKKHISASESLWSIYPGYCPYCASNPCICASVEDILKKKKFKFEQSQIQGRPITLCDFFKLINQIYNPAIMVFNLNYCILMLYEQASEVSLVINGRNDAFESAIADYFTWLISIVKKLNIDIISIEKNLISLQPTIRIQEEIKREFTLLNELWDVALKADQRTKGKALEDFAFTLFNMVPSFRMKQNVKTDTSEFDLIIGINPEKRGGMYWTRYQPLIFVECKNRIITTSQSVISTILGKVVVHDSGRTENLIFVLSNNHFSGEALQQAKYAYLKGFLIVPISNNDINQLLEEQKDIHEFLCDHVENICARVKSVMI